MVTASALYFFFFQAEDGIRDADVTGVQTCALPILRQATERLALSRPITQPARWRLSTVIAAVLGLDAMIVSTHQLTPYVVLVSLAALALLDLIRARWVVLAVAIITFGYLAANWAYISHNFALFTSLDPFRNILTPSLRGTPPIAG